MTKLVNTLAILAVSVLASACTDELSSPPNMPPSGSTSGDESTTFDHQNNGISPWDLLDRLQQEGPPSYTSHVHSCSKVRYANLGNIMTSVGINTANATQLSAGDLYNTGFNALGGSNYANRIRENIAITTSGASREFDIFAAGAPEVITNLPTVARCGGAQLFNGNTCLPEGITCLIGVPATATHVALCNETIVNATDPTTGQRIAVAAMLAAAYTCE
jgi:hypothetical protein